MIQFHNATDIDGHIVHINEVTKENRAGHYYCVGCGGEMSAVLGDKREHHFRHKEAHCSWESYLHKLGKMRLKQRFESEKEFVAQYQVEYYCDKTKGCRLERIYHDIQNCNRREWISVDLKKEYDTCEEEVFYKGYKADLMLSSKAHPEREPLFLEIHVTNLCSPSKLASGIKIIEIDIEKEEDVLKLIVESPLIRFYNFEKSIETKRPLDRFWVANDNEGTIRGYCAFDGLNCKDANDNHHEDALYELAIPSEVGNNRGEKPNLYKLGMTKAVSEGIDVRHCAFCKRYLRCKITYNVEKVDANTGKKEIVPDWGYVFNMPEEFIDKVLQAAQCPDYSCNKSYVSSESDKVGNLICWEWKRG